jgi:hypothetical protein
VNKGLEMTKKETYVAYFKVFSQHMVRRTTQDSYNHIMWANKNARLLNLI